MCRSLLTLALGLAAAGLAPARAAAQFDPWAAAAAYNQERAYRHFLNSPYSYRTYSSASPGYAYSRLTPYGYEYSWRGPGYLHQRITPRGFESYQVVPGSGGGFAVRPGLVIPYPVPDPRFY